MVSMTTASLRSGGSGIAQAPARRGGDVTVDKPGGIIRNVALMTVGPALGHGFDLDQTSIEQLVALAKAAEPEGVKCRYKHPPIQEKPDGLGGVNYVVGDDTGTMVGRIKNVRLDGDCARGDVHLGDYASMLPMLGNVRDYLLAHAESDPAGIGMSAMFDFTLDTEIDPMTGQVLGNPARLIDLMAIDFVGKPAGNPNGLLHAHSNSLRSAGNTGAALAARLEMIGGLAAIFLDRIVKKGPQDVVGLAMISGANDVDRKAAVRHLKSKGFAIDVGRRGQTKLKATAAGIVRATSREFSNSLKRHASNFQAAQA